MAKLKSFMLGVRVGRPAPIVAQESAESKLGHVAVKLVVHSNAARR